MKAKKAKNHPAAAPATPLRLDLGCGPHKREGFTGVDSLQFPGVDVVADLTGPWPWPDNSVEEIQCSHVIEHFDVIQRVHVYNEMFRVLRIGGKATLIAPHWSSGRAYGDPTHKWPPISGFSFFYLLKAWRDQNAPHTDAAHNPTGYTCDFDATWGFSLHPQVGVRNSEYQQFAINFYTEAAQDIIVTLTKRDANPTPALSTASLPATSKA